MATPAKVIPAISKLSHGIIRILGCNPGPMTLQGTNTYLIGTGKKRILLDTGDKGVTIYQKRLSDLLKVQDVDIEHIVLSHWHPDHTGGLESVYDNILGSKQPLVWKFKRTCGEEDLPKSIPINWLEDGQEISVEGATLVVHHTPGHTTDHIILRMNEDNAIFSGDCVLGEGTAVFEDLYLYMQSLNRILALKPDVIYPGHGNVITDPVQKIEYYIEHRTHRENQILEALKNHSQSSLNEIDLVKIIYSETPEQLWTAAAYNVSHHLDKLTKENKVKCVQLEGQKKWSYNPSKL